MAVLTSFSCPTAFVISPIARIPPTSRRFVATTKLPPEVVQYGQVLKTGVFSADNIPQGLLKNHSTKEGTWGIIRVLQGKLQYSIHHENTDTSPAEVFELDTNMPGFIEPRVLHQVAALTDTVEFVVESYRLPDTGPVDETRE